MCHVSPLHFSLYRVEPLTLWDHPPPPQLFLSVVSDFLCSLHLLIFGQGSGTQLFVNADPALFDMKTNTRVHWDTCWELYISGDAELQGLSVMKCLFIFSHIFLYFGSNQGKISPFDPGDLINPHAHWKMHPEMFGLLQRLSLAVACLCFCKLKVWADVGRST